MKIAVIGAGGVGGYFGGMLSRAGFPVVFLTRGKALRAIEQRGLIVKSILGDFTAHPEVSSDPSELNKADLILICTKSWQIEEIARSMAGHIKSSAVVLPLQNGADNAERLISILQERQVLGGLCKIVSKIESPGVIDHFAYTPEIVYGELDKAKSDRVLAIKKVFDAAGFKNTISENIQRDIWLKFLFIASISALGAVTRSVLGVLREEPFLRGMIIDTAKEIVAVGQAQGVDIREDDIDFILGMVDQGTYDTTMSMQRDIMEEKPSELENFNGYIVKKGNSLGVDTPINDFLYYTLLPMEKRARQNTANKV